MIARPIPSTRTDRRRGPRIGRLAGSRSDRATHATHPTDRRSPDLSDEPNTRRQTAPYRPAPPTRATDRRSHAARLTLDTSITAPAGAGSGVARHSLATLCRAASGCLPDGPPLRGEGYTRLVCATPLPRGWGAIQGAVMQQPHSPALRPEDLKNAWGRWKMQPQSRSPLSGALTKPPRDS